MRLRLSEGSRAEDHVAPAICWLSFALRALCLLVCSTKKAMNGVRQYSCAWPAVLTLSFTARRALPVSIGLFVCSAGPVPSCRSPVPMPLFFSTEARQRRCDCAWEQPSRFSLGKRLGPLPPGIRAIEPYLLRCVPLLARPQTRDRRRLMREHSHRCCALCNYKTLFETLDTVCDIA